MGVRHSWRGAADCKSVPLVSWFESIHSHHLLITNGLHMKGFILALLFLASLAGSAYGGWLAAESYSTKLRSAQTALTFMNGMQGGIFGRCTMEPATKPSDALREFGKGFGLDFNRK